MICADKILNEILKISDTLLSHNKIRFFIIFIKRLLKMGRIIIEYCGGWGYGGPANRLKKFIAEHIPNIEIENISAGKTTSKIEVYWVAGDERKAIWSNGKAATEENHKEIV